VHLYLQIILCYNGITGELIKNIGLGLFVNGTFSLANEDISLKVLAITTISLYLMIIGIILEKDKR
jgi:hypothetical protein